jgi:multiple sugar transport system ATP-binding protein
VAAADDERAAHTKEPLMASVELEHIDKTYDNGFVAVKDLNLKVEDGEFLVLVGPSGCGKTTALRMVAGLEDITGGELRIGDRRVNEVPPKDRDIAMVFQSYALYPHMTVAENIGFGLKLRKMDKSEIEKRVKEAAGMLGLDELLDRRPKQLSGGQRQRVAMGRAIVREPQVFLMDEPLSNLDAKMRVQTRAEISRIQQRLGVTTLYVTHDQVEAMTMGSRVAVMKKGVLQQVDTPQFIYDNPANLFVAGFIGSPPMNLCEGVIVPTSNGEVDVVIGENRLRVPASTVSERAIPVPDGSGRKVVVGIRPEDMQDGSLTEVDPTRKLSATVDITEALGSEVMAYFGVDAQQVFSDGAKREDGEELKSIGADAGSTFVASFNARSRVRPGDRIEVAVDTTRLHFFDATSGERLGNAR